MKAKILSVIDSKTIKVISTTYKKHKTYGKYVTVSKSFIVDTSGRNDIKIGKEIDIVSSRPISKRKKWVIK